MSILTTSNGNPVDNDQTSITAGPWGPVLIQDFHLIDKLAHFDRERIPERVVHAKGAGAHGEFGRFRQVYAYINKERDVTIYLHAIELQLSLMISHILPRPSSSAKSVKRHPCLLAFQL